MKKLVCEKCGYEAEDESVEGVMEAMWRHVIDSHTANVAALEEVKPD